MLLDGTVIPFMLNTTNIITYASKFITNLIFLDQDKQPHIRQYIAQMPLVSRQPAQQTAEANRDHHHPVLFVVDIEHPAVHDILVIIRQCRLVFERRGGVVGCMVVRGSVEVQRRRQYQRHLLLLEKRVYLAIVVEQEVAVECRAFCRQSVHPLELLALGIESVDLEDVLEERYPSRRRHDYSPGFGLCGCVLDLARRPPQFGWCSSKLRAVLLLETKKVTQGHTTPLELGCEADHVLPLLSWQRLQCESTRDVSIVP